MCAVQEAQWLLANGCWGLLLCCGDCCSTSSFPLWYKRQTNNHYDKKPSGCGGVQASVLKGRLFALIVAAHCCVLLPGWAWPSAVATVKPWKSKPSASLRSRCCKRAFQCLFFKHIEPVDTISRCLPDGEEGLKLKRIRRQYFCLNANILVTALFCPYKL